MNGSLPAAAVPAAVSCTRSILRLTDFTTIEQPLPIPTTWEQFLLAQPSSITWALEFCSDWSSLPRILASLQRGDLCAVSDGSFQEPFATAGWVFESKDQFHALVGGCVSPGDSSYQSPGRAELAGLYSILAVLYLASQFHRVDSGSIEIGCDSTNSLRDCFSDDWKFHPNKPHLDLIWVIRTLVKKTPVKVSYRYVPGHILDKNPGIQYEDLDRWGQLNEDMDARAKSLRIMIEQQEDRPIQHEVFGEHWSLWDEDIKICKDPIGYITAKVEGVPCIAYWEKRGKFGSGVSSQIDWLATAKLMQELPGNRARWLTKHCADQCGTGKQMVRYQRRLSATCPMCPADEDASHVWTCPSQHTQALWDSTLVSLETWLKEQDTDPALTELLVTGLDTWRSGKEPPSTPLPELALRQKTLGWQSIFEGRPALGWALIQDDFYGLIGSKRSGRRWLVQVLLKLIGIPWDLWEHRNGYLYKKNQLLAYEIQFTQIRRAFRDAHHHTPSDARRFFRRGLQFILSRPPHIRAAWIHNVHAALTSTAASNHQLERRQLIRQQRLLANFLGRTSSNPGN